MTQIKAFLFMALLLMLGACSEQRSSDFHPGVEAVKLNNEGVALMGAFDYAAAHDVFSRLLELQPEWQLAHENLLIATLNRQEPGDEEQALATTAELLQRFPEQSKIQYIRGILLYNQGQCDLALPLFEAVMQADPADAYAHYFAGQCLIQSGELDRAGALFSQAMQLDPYLRSAYYGAFLVAQRAGDMGAAEELLAQYQKLEMNPLARLAEIKYTRMGAKAMAQNHVSAGQREGRPAQRVLGAPFSSEPQWLFDAPVKQLSLVDLQRDGSPQIAVIQDDGLRFWQRQPGGWQQSDAVALPLDDQVRHVSWADFNNDGLIDAYISGAPDAIRLQTESAAFIEDDMQERGLSGVQSEQVRWLDADHDGDLDLLILDRAGQFQLWNNNGNGTHQLISADWLEASASHRALLSVDLDGDRDVDLVLASDQGLTVLRNDRMWNYQTSTLAAQAPLQQALFSYDADGVPVIWTLRQAAEDQGPGRWVPHRFDFRRKQLVPGEAIQSPPLGQRVELVDVQGLGQPNLLTLTSEALHIYSWPDGELLQSLPVSGGRDFQLLNTVNGPELVVSTDRGVAVYPASADRAPFVLLSFDGKSSKADSMRSNRAGIGTEFHVHSGDFVSKGNSFYNRSTAQQNFQPVAIAAGADPIDYLAMEWSDGVFQTELSLAAGVHHAVSETQRQLSSCPVLFVWHDGAYRFVTDVLGVGGMGFALGRDEFAEPRPQEHLLLSTEQVTLKDGHLWLHLTEPMEESAYLDALSVQVIDAPSGVSLTLDERMATGDPAVTGAVIAYRESRLPDRVVNGQGHDVTAANRAIDAQPLPLSGLHPQYLGHADGEQLHVFEFAQPLSGDWVLVFNGWVEYGYSQTGFAAWQAGATLQPPSLDVWVDGRWQPWLNEFGYPAGMPREASVPLRLGQLEVYKFRLRTNQEVYFDQVKWVRPDAVKLVRHRVQQPATARLIQLGFPQRNDLAHRYPVYDFSQRSPYWDTRYMRGAYTRLGDVHALLAQRDNALVIMAAGESVNVAFDLSDVPEPSPGMQRHYLLRFDGWAKDMDLLTRDGDTIDPVPSIGTRDAAAAHLHDRLNTRFMSGH